MDTIAPIVLEGLVTEDGGLVIQAPLSLPPGPVRITLESLKQRLPDPPWPDESISAPFDLPYPGPSRRVTPRIAKERLPEPMIWSDDDDDDL